MTGDDDDGPIDTTRAPMRIRRLPAGLPGSSWSGATISLDFAASGTATNAPLPEPPDDDDEFSAGALIGHAHRFELIEPLGAGGMGRVFRALDRELSRYVAIKFMQPTYAPGLDAELDLLRNEARAIARLNHGNVVHVFDIGLFNSRPFIVMELLDGEPLKSVVSRGPLPLADSLHVADQLLAGLGHAHSQGVVHRDLKPGNVFRTQDRRVVILDFGIALFERVARRMDADLPRMPAGTPFYMSPEQWLDQPQSDATDIWSVGVMLYEMLTGDRPFNGASAGDLRRQVTAPGPAVFLRRSDCIPAAIYSVLLRALEKDPTRRYRDVAAFRQALWTAAEELGVGDRATGTHSALQVREQRMLSVLAASVDADASMPFAQAAEIMRAWQHTVAGEIHRAGGTLVSSVADHVMAVFGYPAVREDDAVRAIRAGQALVRFAANFGARADAELDVRVAVDSRLGVVEVDAGRPVLQGDATVDAVALRDTANAGEVRVDAGTRELARGYFAMQPTSGDAPEGRTPYQVLFPIDVAARFDAQRGDTLLPLLGRDTEMAAQDTAWRKAIEGRGRALVFSGEAGLGKSRLLYQLRRNVLADGGTTMTCQCWPQSQGTPFQPVISLLLRAMGIDPSASNNARKDQLAAALESIGLDPETGRRLLGPLLSVDTETGESNAPAGRQRAALIDQVVQVIWALAKRAPVALIVEDLHWVDYSTLDFIEALLSNISAHPVLLVMTTRPEFQIPWDTERLTHRRLEPLLPHFAERIVAATARQIGVDDPLPRGMVSDIIKRCEGIPLYLEEMTRLLVRAGLDGETLDGGLSGSLREMLGARLDRLSANARGVAQVGSVLGREFRRHNLDQLDLMPETTLNAALAELERERVLSTGGDRLFFRHALVRDAAYEGLTDDDRCALHGQVAALLRTSAEAGHPVPPALLALHFDKAGMYDIALDHWEVAGRQAARRFASKEATDHLQRAVELLQQRDDEGDRARELSVLLVLGPALMSVRGYANPDVQTAYARAYALADADSAAQVFSALVGLWQYDMVGGRLTRSEEIAERLLDLAQKSGNSTLLLIGRRALGTSTFLRGNLQPAIDLFDAGWQAYDIAKHGELAFKHGNDPGVGHAVYLAWGLCLAGRPDSARQAGQNAVELADTLDHPMSRAFSRTYAALAHNLSGDFDRAHALCSEAVAISEEHGLELWYAFASIQLGAAEAGLGQLDAGIERLRTGIAAWKQTGAGAGTTSFDCVLADALLRAERHDEMGLTLDGVAATIERNDEHYYEPEMLRLRAAWHASGETPDLDAAIGVLEQAVAQAREQRAWGWVLRAMGDLVELRTRRDGRPTTDDLTVLAAVRAEVTEGAATPDVIRADRALGEAAS